MSRCNRRKDIKRRFLPARNVNTSVKRRGCFARIRLIPANTRRWEAFTEIRRPRVSFARKNFARENGTGIEPTFGVWWKMTSFVYNAASRYDCFTSRVHVFFERNILRVGCSLIAFYIILYHWPNSLLFRRRNASAFHSFFFSFSLAFFLSFYIFFISHSILTALFIPYLILIENDRLHSALYRVIALSHR